MIATISAKFIQFRFFLTSDFLLINMISQSGTGTDFTKIFINSEISRARRPVKAGYLRKDPHTIADSLITTSRHIHKLTPYKRGSFDLEHPAITGTARLWPEFKSWWILLDLRRVLLAVCREHSLTADKEKPRMIFLSINRGQSLCFSNIKIASYSPNGKEKRGYGATKTSATGANRCWCSVLRCAATQQ